MKEFNLCIRTIRTELKKIIEIGPPIALCYVSCCLNLTIYNLENKLKITRQIDDGRLRMSLFTQSVIITISLSPYLTSLSLSISLFLSLFLLYLQFLFSNPLTQGVSHSQFPCMFQHL